MVKKDTGCSGSGFFDTFSIHRHDEYTTIAPNINHVSELTDTQINRFPSWKERGYMSMLPSMPNPSIKRDALKRAYYVKR